MSRSGYSDDWDDDDGRLQLYRQAVDRAIAGKRGQAFLHEMAAALDAMPVKELIADDVVRSGSQVCALGSVALARGLDVSKLDIYDGASVGEVFGIARSMASEIAYWNDEQGPSSETPEARWKRMRSWVDLHIWKPTPAQSNVGGTKP